MRVLRFLWQRVLAFDRIGSRIPQLIQIWLVELFFVMPLAFFIGKVIDIRGAFGVPGTGESSPASGTIASRSPDIQSGEWVEGRTDNLVTDGQGDRPDHRRPAERLRIRRTRFSGAVTRGSR